MMMSRIAAAVSNSLAVEAGVGAWRPMPPAPTSPSTSRIHEVDSRLVTLTARFSAHHLR